MSEPDGVSSPYSMKSFRISIPRELVAQYPLEERDQSRLLVYDIARNLLLDGLFTNALDYLSDRDCLVYNDARVINARVFGKKAEGGAGLELLLTRRLGLLEWKALIRPARRVRPGTRIIIPGGSGVEVIENLEEGMFRVRTEEPVGYERLKVLGEIPLPKYIRRKPLEAIDAVRYQTVFSRKDGAVASPTAGLHFSERLLERIRDKGVALFPVTLYVDWGTFKPVKAEDYRQHRIHKEMYEITEESAAGINRCIEEGRRILCVGTTSVRTLETAFMNARIGAGSGETGLYIHPGYEFKVVDGMFTNFHMPDSTLILLVAAFGGKEGIEAAYRHAVERKYRFFSYGDAMFMFNK